MSTTKAFRPTKLRGDALLRKVVNHVIRKPEGYDQRIYSSFCGARHCIAGWTVHFCGFQTTWCSVEFGANIHPQPIATVAADLLGLSRDETWKIFWSRAKFAYIYRFAYKRIAGKAFVGTKSENPADYPLLPPIRRKGRRCRTSS
ncbi:MAG: hypothetical protein ACYCQK_01280 [Acidiferrobacteraceae bacterium]